MIIKDQKEKAWNLAEKVPGRDPAKYRQDPYDNIIYKPSYGKLSEMGWEVDHIKPVSKGGSDATRNLQALSTKVNRSKGSDQQKRSRHSKSNK